MNVWKGQEAEFIQCSIVLVWFLGTRYSLGKFSLPTVGWIFFSVVIRQHQQASQAPIAKNEHWSLEQRYSKSPLELCKPFRETVSLQTHTVSYFNQWNHQWKASTNQNLFYHVTPFLRDKQHTVKQGFQNKNALKHALKNKDDNICHLEDGASRKILACTAFFDLSFLMLIYICYKQDDMMGLYLCFSCFRIYMQGRQQVWCEQPVQNRSRENTWLWLTVPLQLKSTEVLRRTGRNRGQRKGN